MLKVDLGWPANDVADDGVGGKGADLVENWCDGLGNELVVPAGEFDVPELQDHGVAAIAQRFFAEIFVSQHAGDVKHGRLWPVEQRQDGVAQDVFQPRAP